MSKPVVWLHIGLPKTGTSSIQRTLKENIGLLHERGWRFTRVLPLGPLKHNFARLLRGGYEAGLRRTLLRAEGQKIIVSEERLDMFLTDQPKAAKALIAELRESFDLQVCIFLRRQDYHADSWVAQKAKMGHPWMARLRNRKFFRADRFDFKSKIENLESLFGQGNIHVGFYRDDTRTDSVQEFARMIDLDTTGFRRAKRVNVTPNRRETVFLSRVGKIPYMTKRFVVVPLAQTGCIANDGARFVLSPAARREALEPWLEGNRDLTERFGPEHTEWFTSLPRDDDTWFPPAPITREEERAALRAAIDFQMGERGRVLGLFGATNSAAHLMIARLRRPNVSLP